MNRHTLAQEVQPTFTMVELTAGVFAAVVVPDPPSYAFANSLVVDLGDGLLVVDTQQSPAAAEALIGEIRARWRTRVRWVVNTHWHGDHVYGNIAYRRAWPDVVFVGHTPLREDLLRLGIEQLERDRAELPAGIDARRGWLATGRGPDGATLTAAQRTRVEHSLALQLRQLEQMRILELVPPDSTFVDTLTLAGPARSVHLFALGPAHTRGDVVVWLPAERILAAGDLVEDAYPWVDDANIDGWVRALDRMHALAPAIVMPAHGSPWLDPVPRLDVQRGAFRAALQAACTAEAAVPPTMASFRSTHGLPEGEAEQRFWSALVGAARAGAKCVQPAR